MNGTPASRILGWDLLRGLCALGVAIYHLLTWQEVAHVHTVGAYGVYIFFVLSGASLAYTYADALQAGRLRLGQFLWVRYMRLAPLYLLLVAVVLPYVVLKQGLDATLAKQLVLNATFLFGFFDPALQSLLIGGWSLGIEAALYLVFPLLLWLALRPGWGLLAGAVLVGLQLGWIHYTMGLPGGYAANGTLYHQIPAFAGYFMGGCLIGVARRRAALRAPNGLLGAGFAACLVAIVALNPDALGPHLTGWRGAVLMALSFAVVWLAGSLRVDAIGRLATRLGDATYGLYLIHPILYFGLAWVVLPRLGLGAPENWPVAGRLVMVAGVTIAAFGLALVSERGFEAPLRRWSKRRTQAAVVR